MNNEDKNVLLDSITDPAVSLNSRVLLYLIVSNEAANNKGLFFTDSHLSSKFNVGISTISKSLKYLEQNELIIRSTTATSSDGLVRHITMTKKCENFKQNFVEDYRAYYSKQTTIFDNII